MIVGRQTPSLFTITNHAHYTQLDSKMCINETLFDNVYLTRTSQLVSMFIVIYIPNLKRLYSDNKYRRNQNRNATIVYVASFRIC